HAPGAGLSNRTLEVDLRGDPRRRPDGLPARGSAAGADRPGAALARPDHGRGPTATGRPADPADGGPADRRRLPRRPRRVAVGAAAGGAAAARRPVQLRGSWSGRGPGGLAPAAPVTGGDRLAEWWPESSRSGETGPDSARLASTTPLEATCCARLASKVRIGPRSCSMPDLAGNLA